MPKYVYRCADCSQNFVSKIGREPTREEQEEYTVFQTEYSIHASKEEIAEVSKCPRCNSGKCSVAFDWHNYDFYFRGNGIVRDIHGAKRDMNVYKLTQDDPYAEYRVPGEVEDIKARLQKTGDYRKGKRTHTDMKVTTDDVNKSTSQSSE